MTTLSPGENNLSSSLLHHAGNDQEQFESVITSQDRIGSSIWGEQHEDDRVALLRMPPPSNDNIDYDYGFSSNEEKKDGGGSSSNNGNNISSMLPTIDEENNNGNTNNNYMRGDNNNNSFGPPSHSQYPQINQSSSSLRRTLPSTSILMKRLGNILKISSSSIFLFIVFPILLHSAIHDWHKGKTDFAAFYSAAGFVVITLVFSFREILSHLYNWYAPEVQKFVVRILFMVPLYSVQSWLSLRFHGPARVYIDTIRDLYEAYVIQSFVYYLIELLGGEDRMAALLSRKDSHYGNHGKLLSTVFRMRRWRMGRDFLLNIKHGVLQYVVVKSFMTLLTTFVFLPSGIYGEGKFSWSSAYTYTTFILNVSVMYALYCLVMLFHAVQSDLTSPINWHPLGKFLCVKGVVFFTFWQGVAISFMRSHGFIADVGTWSGEDVANGIIAYLVCVEMVFFSIAHMFTFTWKEYLPEGMEDQKNSGIVGWFFGLFEGIDKRRRNQGGGIHQSHSAGLLQDDEEVIPCIDENGNISESNYRPPTMSSSGFSKLQQPMSLRDALWSSTVPRETLDDIKRLGVVSGVPGSSHINEGGIGIDISLTSYDNAESI